MFEASSMSISLQEIRHIWSSQEGYCLPTTTLLRVVHYINSTFNSRRCTRRLPGDWWRRALLQSRSGAVNCTNWCCVWRQETCHRAGWHPQHTCRQPRDSKDEGDWWYSADSESQPRRCEVHAHKIYYGDLYDQQDQTLTSA